MAGKIIQFASILWTVVICLAGNVNIGKTVWGITPYDTSEWTALLSRLPVGLKQALEVNDLIQIAQQSEKINEPELAVLLLELESDYVTEQAAKALERCGTLAQLPALLHRLEQKSIPPAGGTETQVRRNMLLMKMEACVIKLLRLELVPERDERIPLEKFQQALAAQQRNAVEELKASEVTPERVASSAETEPEDKKGKQLWWTGAGLAVLGAAAWLVTSRRRAAKIMR
jgi:hypothetical protein